MSRTAIVLFIALAIFSSSTFADPIVCNRENEEYKCGSACQTRCDNLNQTCPIVNFRCNDLCYCKEGYARISDDKSRCIPINKCPSRRRHVYASRQ